MIARAETSTNAQSPHADKSASNGMFVALIGPNDAHRKVVAQALSSSQGRKVHEFIDYPASLSDLPGMVSQNFDVVLVDVDTDESYALQIIAKLAEIDQPVMAYSARTDQELLMSCMRAGARDFLPLPTENAVQGKRTEQSSPAPSPAAPVAKQAAAPAARPAVAAPTAKPAASAPPAVAAPIAKPAAAAPAAVAAPIAKPAAAATPAPVAARPAQPPTPPAPAPLPTPPAARAAAKPVVSQNRLDPGAETWFARAEEEHKEPAFSEPALSERDPVLAQVIEEITIGSRTESRSESSRQEIASAEKAPSEFDAWDAANLRPAPPAPTPIKRAESRPRPALVPERRKSDATPRPLPSLEATPAPAVERPPVSVDLFRSSQLHTVSEPDEAAEKQGAKWIKWILIAAGPMVLALVLLVVFTRPSASNSSVAKPVKEATPAPPDLSQPNLIVNQPVRPVGKPAAGTTIAKDAVAQSAGQADATTTEAAAPVSPDAMAQQLVAPSRIAGKINKAAPSDEPPPTAPAAVSMDDNSGLPSSLFANGSKTKVAPHVVPISAGVADGMILRKTPPVYPKFAQDAHITGKVLLKATITKQGTIEGVQVLSGPKILAPSAVEAVKTWRYRPYMLDNQPVSVETEITIVFGAGGK